MIESNTATAHMHTVNQLGNDLTRSVTTVKPLPGMTRTRPIKNTTVTKAYRASGGSISSRLGAVQPGMMDVPLELKKVPLELEESPVALFSALSETFSGAPTTMEEM